MKNTIKNTKKGILMVTMFATLLSFADDASFYALKNDAGRTSLTLNNVKQGNLLTIKDENGMLLYKEFIKKTGTYNKGFDLTSLPDGNYLFELEKDLEINTIPFAVKTNTVVFKKENEKTIFKPYTRVVGNVAYLTKLALNAEPLKVEIYFNNEGVNLELIFSETIENTVNISRVYKLSNLKKGNYKIVYSTNGRIFTKEIID